MDVPVSTLRAELKHWIALAGEGEDVVITERGVPVARLTPVAGADLIADLERDGLLAAPTTPRPRVEARPAGPAGVSGLVRRLRR
ncbi:prevent-host-death family protein [Beutenbergia cavernae DSM 12333]|uniref:Prevent-host-death family protein n=1 Tax=Beutenbergia cavernae (strain ATCC BAA-8 / DSM 12333 / CCUG 43141 / JCM 11478 / NBRC 16432 / NCIMB 13614 / HKI 0122) TaxID=471853 RepID=C5C230_BEUC1|nr:type II toxin-antitoxin system prevent-host-death family antitoxin [Beutenbergia cavernae]ACQ81655.1 prevent-host-death family protein [Beutenbergia cavernae DSM 12333]